MQEKNSLSKQFSSRFSEAIGKLGIKQKELSEQVNIREQTLSRYKSGTRLPDTEELHRLAKFFGVTMDWLIGEDESTDESIWQKRALAAEAKLAKYKSITTKFSDLTQELARLAVE